MGLWTLYDFANSIFIVVFYLYFSQWLVVDHGVSDLWFNLIFVGSTLLLLLTSPLAAVAADKSGGKLSWLRWLTVLTFLSLLLTSIVANFYNPTKTVLILAALGYLLANYFYQFSFTFYNAFLRDIAPFNLRGMISGIGQCANWLGEIAGLLVTLPLITGAVVLMGNPGRSQTFLPATCLFFLFSLPVLFWFRETTIKKKSKTKFSFNYKSHIADFKSLLKAPGMKNYLLGYFFFNDAILTASNNFPIFLDQVFKISDDTKSILLLGILVTAALGALTFGMVSDKVGHKKSLIWVLISWAIVLPLLSVLTNFTYFVVASIAMGFLFGATWTVTRAVMDYLSPEGKVTHAFSYYTLAERFSTLIGPLTWGLITHFLLGYGELRYRVAALSMTVFILLGLLLVRNIPSKVRAC